MILTIVISILAGCGVCFVLYLLLEALSAPIALREAAFVVDLQGDASEVAQTVRSCLRLCDRRGLRARLIFVDRGVDAEGQMAVELLLRRTDAVLCAPSQVCDFLE